MDEVADAPAGGKARALRTAGVLAAIAAVSGIWIFAFFFSDRGFPGKIEDSAAVAQADSACDRAQTFIEALPRAASAPSPEVRAETLSLANAELRRLVRDLREIRLASADDQAKWDRWLDDWDTYIDNRESHTERLRSGEDARFQVAVDDEEQIITAKMDTFAVRNGMRSCATPLDV